MEELEKLYRQAAAFTEKHHLPDLEWIRTRESLVSDFQAFFLEYVYVVCASGFKGRTAAALCDRLVACDGDEEKMLSVFRNKVKVGAIAKCYKELKDTYETVSKGWKTPGDLVSLPYIGNVTCHHLARNIGLRSGVKPDLHLTRIVGEMFHLPERGIEEATIARVEELSELVKTPPGEVDFCLWVYLSHGRGKKAPCCDGGYRLR